jgi:hypothetical protein
MTAPIDLYHLKERCAALASEALSRLDPGVQAQAFPYTVVSNDVYPFFSFSQPPFEIGADSQDIDTYLLRLPGKLIVGHNNGGAIGEYERKLDVYTPQLAHYFNEREMLQSDTFPTRANIQYARITGVSGLTQFSQSGTGMEGGQLGVTFTVEITLYNEICQQYL